MRTPRSHCRAPLRLPLPPSHCNVITADRTFTSHFLFNTPHVVAGWASDLIGGSRHYPLGNYSQRAAIWKAHRDYVLGVLWTMAHDPDSPTATKGAMADWGPSSPTPPPYHAILAAIGHPYSRGLGPRPVHTLV